MSHFPEMIGSQPNLLALDPSGNLSSLRRWHKLWGMALHELFFYLTIILLPTQLGLHFWPDWALVLGRRIDYLSPTLFLTDITMIATLLLWICSPHKTTKKITVVVFCVLAYIICNIYFSTSPYVVLFRWIKVVEFVLFGYYIVKTKPSLKITSLAITITMMYSSIIAIVQFVFQHSIGGALWYLGERSFDISTAGIARVNWCWLSTNNCMELLRPYGTFSHPNVLAGFFAITICLCLYHNKISLWYAITMIVSSIALILTFSRSVWIIAIIGIGTIIGLQHKKRAAQIIPWIAIACITCIGIAFPYFLSLFQHSESMVVRKELSLAAITMWKSYPLIGVGFSAFLVRLPTILPSRYLFFLQPPHSVYLLLLSELGVIGVTCIGWLLYKLMTRLLQMPNKIPLIIVLVYGLLGTIDHYPITLQQGQLLTTIVLTLSFLSYVK